MNGLFLFSVALGCSVGLVLVGVVLGAARTQRVAANHRRDLESVQPSRDYPADESEFV